MNLSPRQAQALTLAAQGLTVTQIAAALGAPRGSASRLLSDSYKRLDARDRADAVRIARRHGLIPQEDRT